MDDNSFNLEGEEPEGTPERIPAEQELQEIVFGPSSTEVEAARSLFREGLVPATQAIIHLAAYSNNDRTRLDAAKYVVERNLGKVTEKLALGDVWENLLSEITSEKG